MDRVRRDGADRGAQAFFEPARTATIPNITSEEELLPANALSSATWSAMLAIGASIGGLVTAVAGRNVAFVVNALRSSASAYFIGRTRYDRHPPASSGLRESPRSPEFPIWSKAFDTCASESHVAALMLREGRLGPGRRRAAAADDLRPARVPGRRRDRRRHRRAVRRARRRRSHGADRAALDSRATAAHAAPCDRTGVLHGRRLLHGARLGADARRSRRCAFCCAHFGGSILWVFSTVLLQLEVPDRFRGRVFAAELALVTLMSSISSYWTGYELDRAGMVAADACLRSRWRCSACPACCGY